MKPTLLVLAAGMGSRYGGLKQMDPFGPNGETLLDYSIYDAINAGFGKVVFVIRASFNEAFRAFFAGKFEDKIEVVFVYQDIHNVPEGCDYDNEREKPWGTSHAVWVAKDVINEPFVVINADDFYGKGAYVKVKEFFENSDGQNYALIGYRLINTLSEHGTVNRGICAADESDRLVSVVETLKIGFDKDRKIVFPKDDGFGSLEPETIVSMNFWGFQPDYFNYCEQMFVSFLKEHGYTPKSEFFIPLLIEDMIKSKTKDVDVIPCDEEWFGVTYQNDKPFVQERIIKLIEAGVYPEKLWA